MLKYTGHWFGRLAILCDGIGMNCRTHNTHAHSQLYVHATPLSGVLPSVRFSHVDIDLVGPLPVSSGFRYCLTAIDRYTRWPEALPLSDITAEAVAKGFVSVSVARFGCPQQITTDQGRHFEARLFKTVATIPDPL